MKPLYHLFRPKMRESSYDEITKHVIDCWDSTEPSQYCDGYMLYINKDSPGETYIQYCDILMKISNRRVMGNNGVVRSHHVRIGYSSPKDPVISSYEHIIQISKGTVELCTKKRHEEEYFNASRYDITVPEELLNEIDFFQFETLNPHLPISPPVLIKLYNKIIKDM